MSLSKFNIANLFVLTLLSLVACSDIEEPMEETDSDTRRYLMLGHTYDWTGLGVKIDTRLEETDFSGYDAIWLGGDVCAETSRDYSTLEYLDVLFDLSNQSTKWAMGNHDIRNGNLDWIKEITKRELHHVDHFDGITFLTINTQVEHPTFIDSCDQKLLQTEFINQVLDTVKASEYLIVLSHNSVWSDLEPSIADLGQIGNQTAEWMDFDCDRESLFRTEFGAKILDIQSAGTQVFLIGGDGGQYQKTFFHHGDSGILYFMSGINNSIIKTGHEDLVEKYDTRPDSVLVFEHDLKIRKLVGSFIPVDEI